MAGLRTAVVVTASSFLLGASFTHWSVDHRTLWTQPITSSAVSHSLAYYSDLWQSPAWIPRTVYALAGLALVSLLSKLVGAGMGAVFDGASVVLLVTAVITHYTHIVPLLSSLPIPYSLPSTLSLPSSTLPPSLLHSLQDIASSHTVISVALTGLIGLQAAGVYVERSVRKAEEGRRLKRKGRRRGSSSVAEGGRSRSASRNGTIVDGGPTTRIGSPPPSSSRPSAFASPASPRSPSKRKGKKKKE